MENENKNLLVSEDDLLPEENNLEKGYTEELDFTNLTDELNKTNNSDLVSNEMVQDVQKIDEPVPVQNYEYEAAPVETIQDVQKNDEPVPVQNYEYEEAPVETYDDAIGDVKKVAEKQPEKINENPMGKIKLNNEEEVEHEYIDPKTIKIDLKGNNNLKFVIVLGILLLIAIIVIPLIII